MAWQKYSTNQTRNRSPHQKETNMKRLCLSHISLLVSLFFVATLLARRVDAAEPRLVLFAGPHKSASTSIEKFFYEYAAVHHRLDAHGQVLPKDQRQKTFGLRKWEWPHIYGVVANETEPDEPYKIFSHLVTDPDNELLQNEILEGIRKSWEEKDIEGVILGTEMFDQISGESPYDALAAIERLVSYLGLVPSNVTVVVNYRAPRFDQWAATWAHDVAKNSDGEGYEEWLCNTDAMGSHVQALATEMNPLNAVVAYLEMGLNVKLLDMSGIEAAGADISHVIACEIITGKCTNGRLKNHDQDTYHENSIAAENTSIMTDDDIADAELLFQYRDCAYEQSIRMYEDSTFEVMYNHSLWSICDPSLSQVYTRLQSETSFMYSALLSQVECPLRPEFDMDEESNVAHGTSYFDVDMQYALTGIGPEEPSQGGGGGFVFSLLAFAAVALAVYVYKGKKPSEGARELDNQVVVMEAEMI